MTEFTTTISAGAGQTRSTNKLTPMAKRYVPIAQVSFHTEDKCYRVRGISKGYEASFDPTDQLISITTNKTLDAPAGTFSVTLAGDGWFLPNDKPILKPNDLVIIYMGYKPENEAVTWVDGSVHSSSEDFDTVMIGLVDTISRTRNGGGSSIAPSIQTTITGRDFGKLLIKAMLKFYPQIDSMNAGQKFFLTETGWLAMWQTFTNNNSITGSPAKIIDTILRFILKKIVDVKWKVYDDNSFFENSQPGYKTARLDNLLRYRLAQTNFFVPFFMSAQQYEGSVWNLMNRVNIKPFTELFIDTRDRWEVANTSGIPMVVNETIEEESSAAKDALTEDAGRWARPAVMFGQKDGAQVLLSYRNTPFDTDSWNKLRKHDITYVDVINEVLSYSDNENYNLFWAGSTITPFNNLNLKSVCPPLINETNVTRYGLNPLEISVEGLGLEAAQEATQTIALEGLSKDLNTKLKRWYENNVTYLSGNLSIRGKGSIKIGQRLNYKGLDYEFYIEGVTQNFQVYGEWQTHLTVTRGQKVYNSQPTVENLKAASAKTDAEVKASYYTTTDTDTLWHIAKVKYGDGNKWTVLWEANKDLMIARDSRNANEPGHYLYGGMVLRIP